MNLTKLGEGTLDPEVTNISAHGLWLFISGQEYFLSYIQFPWFRNAKVAEILNVQMPSLEHLYWPDLDVDLHLESITNPDKYPLVSKS